MKKVAIIGCGRISKRHIEAISTTRGIEIALVCDVNKEKAKATAEQLQVPYICDYRKLSGVDIAAVLTPSGMHPRHATEIAESTDISYIICEKPLSLTVREAKEMLNRIKHTEKKLLPVYQNRYNPLIVYTKKLISDGHLGKIYQFICNVLWNRNDKYFDIDWHGTMEFDGGVLYTQASHYVDMLHFLFGEVNEHKGIGGKLRGLEVYDSLSASMSFKNGVIGSLNATVSVYEKNYLTEMTIIGEKGTVRLSGTNLNTIDFWNVEGLAKPNMNFSLDHIYGKGHDTMYQYIVEEKWDMFPSDEDVISGIRLMEMLSY